MRISALPCHLFLLASWPASPASPAAPLPAEPGRLAVREVTVFKDGHAFVLEEGRLAVGASGNVILDRLPAPVLGTFWPYSSEAGVKLSGVVAGQERVASERDALSIRELLEANTGAEVLVSEAQATPYLATIVKVPGAPGRSGPTPEAATAPERHPGGEVALLKTDGGVKAVPLDRISEVTFPREHRTTIRTEENQSRLTLRLDWGPGGPRETAALGMVYLQKGLRWIPEYKIVLDGKGKALVRLQATLINELTDLERSRVHLVVGVPGISFKDTLDPLALRKTAAELSQYFREDAQTRFALSNAIMTQARMGERGAGGREAPPAAGEAEAPGGGKDEDLFIFDLEDITLRKGERMVVPVAEYPLEYREVFTLDLPFSPPRELRANPGSDQERALARLLGSPRVLRKVRLLNRSAYPITTAPALVFAGEMLLGQGLTAYAAINGSCDLTLTTAIDIQVQRTDRETGRKSEEIVWQSSRMLRIDLKGAVALTNRLGRAVDLEVTRQVLGAADEAGQGGTAEQVNPLEDDSWLGSEGYPAWWGWYNWPAWWARFNGVGRFHWTVRLEPGGRIELPYAWHYYWN